MPQAKFGLAVLVLQKTKTMSLLCCSGKEMELLFDAHYKYVCFRKVRNGHCIELFSVMLNSAILAFLTIQSGNPCASRGISELSVRQNG
jgi:hypothetical protein